MPALRARCSRRPATARPAHGVGLDAGARSSPTTCGRSVGRAYPRVRGMVREPSWLFFEILLPFLTTSAFVFVYRALQAPRAYVGFVVLGGAMTAFWLNVIWMMAEPAVLGEEPGQPRALLRGADEPHVDPVRDGRRRAGHELDPRGRVLVVSTIVYGVDVHGRPVAASLIACSRSRWPRSTAWA